jgi:hypothetical protein
MSSYEDNQPLNRSLHSSVAAPSISVPVEPSGQLGVNGLQPSFALELDISSIEHVMSLYIYLYVWFINSKILYRI